MKTEYDEFQDNGAPRPLGLFLILLWLCLFSFEMFFLLGLEVTHLCAVLFCHMLISSIIDICNGEIYELWPFSFLLLVMQLSEDKKKKKAEIYHVSVPGFLL